MKKHNFSPGPSILPQYVFDEAVKAIQNFNDTGLSVLEISHRSKGFIAVMEETKSLINELFDLKDEFHILFLTGGASTQFFMAPMNYLSENEKALYLDTGTWSAKAIKEAKDFGQIEVVASSKDSKYNHIPKGYSIDPNAKFLHLTSNNTIFGTQIHEYPDTKVPFVCDMSSDIMSRTIDSDKFNLIYAGAQKNLGPAGVTIVLLRKDWSERAERKIPSMLNYETHIAKDSSFNTPPVFSIFGTMLNLRWLKEQGGVGAIEEKNNEKAKLLYTEIDRNSLFTGTAAKEDRSKMNATFVMNDDSKTQAFLDKCAAAGVDSLKGHRSAGGFRASIYNALPLSSVQVLVDLMADFEKTNG